MARRPATIKRKPKTVRTNRSEQFIINQKYLGDEPVFGSEKPLRNIDMIKAYNWYANMCTTDDARRFIVDYLVALEETQDAKIVKSLPDNAIPQTVAWTCRLICRDCYVPDATVEYVNERLKEIVNKARNTVQDKSDSSDPQKPSVQDRMREKSHDILGEVEGWIDDYLDSNESPSFYDWLKTNEIPAVYTTKIIEKLTPQLGEFLEVLDTKDAQLKEGYAHLTKKKLKQHISFYNSILEDCERYASNTKKTRAPRKPRPMSVEKKLKSFKFQKEDNAAQIASISPEKIIGAQELWTYNTRYKTLTVLRAIDRGGIQVKGTSFTGYDEKNSVTKRTGRQAEVYVKKVLGSGKVALRKLMDELKTEAPLAARSNEQTILLRVI